MKKIDKKLPLVSIIINCYNGEKYLSQTISSVLKQSYKKWEIIFWDNKSTDKSKKIVKKYKDKRIKYYCSTKLVKLYKARNFALKKCSGEYITFLDVDDYWFKDKLKEQIYKIYKSRAEMIYSNCMILNESKNTKKIWIKKQLPEGNITNELLKSYEIGLLTVMIKKKVMDKVKFYDGYSIIGDFDLFIKLSMKISILCVQKPLGVYRLHSVNFSSKNKKLLILELDHWYNKNKATFKNYNIFYLKNYILFQKIKLAIFNSEYFKAIKFFNNFPLNYEKIKLFIMFFLPKKNLYK
jgi:glycosyltransferase involved in cell wall biosynthesis|tara:strand:- start:1504 stop:2388 length:885 start_codon:yes stop_codon:yes gene_type:complete